MDDGLQYTELTIAQGTGDNANDTIISKGSEYLAILQGIDVALIAEADFTPVDIAWSVRWKCIGFVSNFHEKRVTNS